MNRALLLLLLAAPPGCHREGAAPASNKPATAPPDLASAKAVPAPPPTPIPPPPRLCEVEAEGRIVVPKRARKGPTPTTFIAIGDCLVPEPKIVGFGGSTFGRFFIEVFVPWGSDLSICAAIEPAPEKPSTLYGKAPIAMHAEKEGEVEFKGLVIELKPGPPKVFAHRAGLPR